MKIHDRIFFLVTKACVSVGKLSSVYTGRRRRICICLVPSGLVKLPGLLPVRQCREHGRPLESVRQCNLRTDVRQGKLKLGVAA